MNINPINNNYHNNVSFLACKKIKISKTELEQVLFTTKSISEAARIIGCSDTSVHNLIKKYGINYKVKHVYINYKKLKRDIEKGLSLPQLAQKYNCNISSIRHYVDKLGYRTKQAAVMDKLEPAYIQFLLDNGYNYNDIANKYGVTPMQVGVFAKRHNIVPNYKRITVQDIIDFKEEGVHDIWTLAEIFGVSVRNLQILLSKTGLSLNNKADRINKTIKDKLTNAIIDNNTKKIFECLKIGYKERQDGKLIISHYSIPQRQNLLRLGLNENGLLRNVVEVEGDINLSRSTATRMPVLERIGGDAWFGYREYSFPKLKEIGGDCHIYSTLSEQDFENIKIVGNIIKK